MLRIRMQRVGKKNRPFFRILVIDAKKHFSRNAEVIGYISPLEHKVHVNEEKMNMFLTNGAKLTRSLFNRLKAHVKISRSSVA